MCMCQGEKRTEGERAELIWSLYVLLEVVDSALRFGHSNSSEHGSNDLGH